MATSLLCWTSVLRQQRGPAHTGNEKIRVALGSSCSLGRGGRAEGPGYELQSWPREAEGSTQGHMAASPVLSQPG